MTDYAEIEIEYTNGFQTGINFAGGKPMRVVARSPEVALILVPGANYFGGIGITAYASARLMLLSGAGERAAQ